MSTSVSFSTALALALASQAESVGSAEPSGSASNAAASKPDSASLLATPDPTRAAFASALLALSVANAPQVAGPYVPGNVSGPLTRDDIFDPSKLYSLPGQELVVIDETTEANAVASNSLVRRGAEITSGDATGVKLPVDVSAAATLEVRPSTLTLELIVAGYLSQRLVGLPPMERKILSRLKSRIQPFFEDRSRSSAETEDGGVIEVKCEPESAA